jgi:hypothetical protein
VLPTTTIVGLHFGCSGRVEYTFTGSSGFRHCTVCEADSRRGDPVAVAIKMKCPACAGVFHSEDWRLEDECPYCEATVKVSKQALDK